MAQLTKERVLKGTPFYYVSLIITVVLMFGFKLLPPFATLTPLGMSVVGIFLGLVWGWSTIGLIVPSILGMVAFGFTSLFANVTAAFTSGIGNQNTLIILMTFGILGILQVTGISKWLALKIVSWKIGRGRPWVLACLLMFAGYALQALTCSMAACLLVWNIFYNICETSRIEKGPYTQFVVFGIILGAILSGQLFPYSWVVLTLTDAFTEVSGLPAPAFGPFVVWNFIIHMLVLAFFFVCGRFILRVKAPQLDKDMEIEKTEPLDVFQKASLAGLAAFIVLLTLAGLLPASTGLSAFLNKFSVVGTASVILVILLGLNFRRCKPLEVYMANACNWGLLFTVACVSILSSAMGDASTGIMEWVQAALGPVFGSANPIVFLILITLIPALLTNVLNNLVMGVIFVPISYTFGVALGLNPTVLCVMVINLVSVATITAAGCQPAAILHGNSEWITSPQAAKFGVFATLASWLVNLCIGYPLGLLFF